VIRDAGGGAFARTRAGTTRSLGATAGSSVIYTFAERQPIGAGELIGLDLLTPSSGLRLTGPDVAGNRFARWLPPLDATPRAPEEFSDGGEMLFNANVEADGDGDGFGDESQDQCPGQAGPNNGCPRGGGPALVLDLAGKKQKLKRKLKFVATANAESTLVARGAVKKTSKQLAANEATRIKAKLKRAKRKRLANKLDRSGMAKAKVKATATDASGATATDKLKVKLKD
jgi:hypothetical protein